MFWALLPLLPIAGAVLGPNQQFFITLENTTTLCGQYENFTTSNSLYTLETNEWGADGSGAQCLLVGNTQGNSSNSTAFAVTWGWSASPQLVHAYPNARYNTPLLPLKLQNLSSLPLQVQWAYDSSADGENTGANNFANLNSLQTSADVAVDMFFDPDPFKAVSTTKASYEIMVWFANFGLVTPIGFANGSQSQKTIGQSTFDLFIGPNGNGQQVFSWLCLSNTTAWSADISPLIRNVAFHGGPNTTDYLGVYQFGTEAFHTSNAANVTFTVQSLTMGVVQGIAPVDSGAPRLAVLTYSLAALLAAVMFQMIM